MAKGGGFLWGHGVKCLGTGWRRCLHNPVDLVTATLNWLISCRVNFTSKQVLKRQLDWKDTETISMVPVQE